MLNQFNLTVLSAGLLFSISAMAEKIETNTTHPVAQIQTRAGTAAPAQANNPVQDKELPPLDSLVGNPAKADPSKTGRFVAEAGTGSSKVISAAKPVQLPKGPLGKPAGDVAKLAEEARAAGGRGLDKIQQEINMPGLKKDDPTLKPFVLHTRNGVNEIVKMSATLLNRIATPFAKPVLIDTSDSTSKIVGSDVYYTPSGDKPIGLFIADSANTSQTISLTIIPDHEIPGQNIMIKMEDLRAIQQIALAAATTEEAEVMQPKSSDYTSYVRSLLTKAVRGNIPGFAPVHMDGGIAQMGSLKIEPQLVFTGSVLDVYRYRIENVGDAPLDLVETAFAREGVKAVSFFPHTYLRPGQQSWVFLLADKPASPQQGAAQ